MASTGLWPGSTRTFRASSSFLRVLLLLLFFTFMYSEEDLSKAIQAYRAGKYTSILELANATSIPRTTLRRRLNGGVSHSTAHKQGQYLSTAKEKTLIRWISRLATQGCPVSPSLAYNLAFEIRRTRYTLSTPRPPPPPPGKHYIDRLRKQYPKIKSIYSRQIEIS